MCRVDPEQHHGRLNIGHELARHLRLVRAVDLGLRDAIGHEAVLLPLGDVEPLAQRLKACALLPRLERLEVGRPQRRTLQPGRLLLASNHERAELPARCQVVGDRPQRSGQRGPCAALQRALDTGLGGIAVVQVARELAGLLDALHVLPDQREDLGRGLHVVQVQPARQGQAADRHRADLGDADRALQQLLERVGQRGSESAAELHLHGQDRCPWGLRRILGDRLPHLLKRSACQRVDERMCADLRRRGARVHRLEAVGRLHGPTADTGFAPRIAVSPRFRSASVTTRCADALLILVRACSSRRAWLGVNPTFSIVNTSLTRSGATSSDFGSQTR